MNSEMPIYYKCNMTKMKHIIVYVICSVLAMSVAYLFYHLVFISLVVGAAIGVLLERIYAESTVSRRQKKLLLQFRDFLEAMSVAAGAGNVEYKAIQYAYESLQISYNPDADIVVETAHIIKEYENGGKRLKELFGDLAERSRLEDIQSFATIYSVIEGKTDNFADIINQTRDIIGDKIEIEQEIETTITSAKNETYIMLVMPIVIVVMLSTLGGGFMDALFTTAVGHIVATVALILFAISFYIAIKGTDITV